MPASRRDPAQRPNSHVLLWVDDRHPLRARFARGAGNSRHGVGLVVQDADDVIVAANADAARILGLSWEQLVGRSPVDARWAALDEFGLPLPGGQDAVVVASRCRRAWGDAVMGVSVPDSSGTVRTRWVSCTSTPLLAPDDRTPVGATTALRDVTSAERGRDATDRALSALRSLASARTDAVLTTRDGQVTWASPEVGEVLGWLPDALVGRPYDQLLHPDDRSAAGARFDGEAGTGWRARMRTASGRWLPVEVSAQPQRDASGAVVGTVETVRDVERAAAVEERAGLSEAELRLLADNARGVVARVSREGILTFVSDSVTEVLGWVPDDLVGQSFLSFVHGDDLARVLAAQAEEPATGLEYEARFAAASGGYRWSRVRARTVESGDAAGGHRVASLVDIEDEVAARRLLQDERDRATATLSALLDPHLLLSPRPDGSPEEVDADWVIEEVNDAACRALGRDRGDLAGSGVRAGVAQPAAAVLLEWCRRVSTSGSLLVDAGPGPGAAGVAEQWCDARGVIVDGRISLTWRDVTAAVRRRREVADAEARYRTVAEHAGDLVVATDPGGRITWVSSSVADAVGWRPEQLVGAPAASYVDDRGAGAAFRAALRGEGPAPVSGVRVMVRCADGLRRWMRCVLRAVPDGAQGVRGRVWICWDVDEEVRAEERTAEGAQHLQQILDHSADVILHSGGDGVLRWASPSLRSVFGYDPADVVGTAFTLASEADAAAWAEELAAIAATHPAHQRRRFQAICSDGTTKWAEARVTYTWDHRDRLTDVVAGIRDVTVEVEALAAAQAEREVLRETFDAMLDPHVDMTAVRDGRGRIVDFEYTDANPPALEYLGGLSRDELVGTRLRAMYPSEAARLLIAQYARTVDTGAPLVLDDYAYSNEQFGGAERRYDLRAARVGDGIGVTWRDVTDRHAAQQELVASEARYRLLADHSADVVSEVDAEGVLTYVSPAVQQLLDWKPNELVGTSLVGLLHPDDREALGRGPLAVLDRLVAAPPWRVRMRRSDDSFQWVGLTGRALYDPVAQVGGGVITWRDVAAEVVAEGALATEREKFRTAMRAAPIGMCLTSADGTLLEVNPALCHLVGRDEAELLAMTWRELTHPDDVDANQALVDDVVAGRRDSYRLRKRYLRPDGSTVWGELSGAAVRDARGTLQHLIAQIVDVTQEQQQQEQLRASEARYRLLVERSADVTVRCGVRGSIEWVSPSVRDILGWDPDDLLGREVFALVHDDDRPLVEAGIATVLAGQDADVEARFRGRDGDHRWLAAVVRPVVDEAGRVVGSVASCRAVDEAIRLRRELQELAERYQLLAEQGADVTFRATNDAVFEWVSPSVEAVLGWTTEEMVGRPAAEFIHTDDLPMLQETSGRIASGAPASFLGRFRRRDGSHRWISARVRPVRDGDGAVTGRVGTWHVVDGEVAARQRLTESEARFRLLAENASDVIYLVDTTGRCQWVSPSVQQVLGWAPGELEGRPMTELVHPDDLPVAQRARQQALAGGSDRHVELRYRTRDGDWRWMSIAGHVVTDDAGRVAGGVTALRDVHALVEARRGLESSERRYRDLAEHSLDVVIRLDADGSIGWVSPSVTRVLGWAVGDFAALPAVELIHPDDLEAVVAGRRESAATGAVSRVDCRILRADRSWEWMAGEGLVLSGADGEPTAMVSLRSIAGERQVRAALESSEQRYRLLAETLEDVVEEYDATWHLTWASPSLERVLGHDPEGLVGTFGPDELHPDDDGAKLREEIDGLVAARMPGTTRRVRRRHADGGWRWVDSTLSFRYDDDGALAAVYVVSRDVHAQVSAELALAQSRQRFQRMFVNHDAVMLLVDPEDGSIVDANLAAAAFYGYTRDELRAMHISQINVLDAAEVDELARSAASRTKNAFVFPHRLADGRTRTVEVRSSPIDDDDRALLFSIVRDITDDVAAREALARSEEQFRRLAESIGDIVLVFNPDRRITWVSPSARRILGYVPEEMLGRRITDFLHVHDHRLAFTLPSPTPGAASEIAVPAQRFRAHTATGVDRWMESSAVWRFDAEGRLTGGLASWRDVEDQVHAEEALHESQQHYQALAEHSGDVVLRLSESGRITWVSPAVRRLTGWEPEQILGRATFDLAHPDDLPRVQAARLEVLDGHTAAFQTRVRRGDGGWQWIHVVSRGIRDERGQVTGIITNWRDATADVAARQALQASETRFRLAMATAPIPMMLLGLDLHITEANDAVTGMLGYDAAELAVLGLEDLTLDATALADLPLADLATGTIDVVTTEQEFRDRDGGSRWGQLSVSLVRDDGGQPSHYIAQLMDVTAVKVAQEQLSWQASHDQLTGLANRAGFGAQLELARERASRHDVPMAVLFCDLDGFKRVNDTYGHDAGDHLLRAIAARLSAVCRATDTVARLGGDEFVVIAEHVRVPEELQTLAERLLDAVCTRVDLPDGGSVLPAMSVGMAVARAGESPRDLLRRADAALYEAKAAGRGRWALDGSDPDVSGAEG